METRRGARHVRQQRLGGAEVASARQHLTQQVGGGQVARLTPQHGPQRVTRCIEPPFGEVQRGLMKPRVGDHRAEHSVISGLSRRDLAGDEANVAQHAPGRAGARIGRQRPLQRRHGVAAASLAQQPRSLGERVAGIVGGDVSGQRANLLPSDLRRRRLQRKWAERPLPAPPKSRGEFGSVGQNFTWTPA